MVGSHIVVSSESIQYLPQTQHTDMLPEHNKSSDSVIQQFVLWYHFTQNTICYEPVIKLTCKLGNGFMSTSSPASGQKLAGSEFISSLPVHARVTGDKCSCIKQSSTTTASHSTSTN